MIVLYKNYCLLFLSVLFTFHSGIAQNKFSALSVPEKKWVVLHPLCAQKINRITKKTFLTIQEVKKSNPLDQYENGGKLDAFRHIYTMAVLAQKISVKKLRRLGIAHEKGNTLYFKKNKLEQGELPDSVSCEMDLRNNEIGFELGRKNKLAQIKELEKIILGEINGGKAWIILRNDKGNYIRCDQIEINLLEWRGKWNIPKCLVRS